MSRNLCKTKCDRCHLRVIKITGERYIGTGRHMEGDLYANAECKFCGALYTAWLTDRHGNVAGVCKYPDEKQRNGFCFCPGCEDEFFDLSYRSTFDDEAGESDLPLPYVSPLEMKEQLEVGQERITTLAHFIYDNTTCDCSPINYKEDCQRHNILYPRKEK